MEKKRGFHSIQTDIVIRFLILILLSSSIYVSFSIFYTKSILKENASEDNLRLVEQISDKLENYITYVDTLPQTVLRQGGMQNYLENEGNEETYRKLQKNIGTILEIRKDIYDIAVVGEQGCKIIIPEKKINHYAGIKEKKWYQKAIQSDRELVLSSHVQNIVEGEYQWVITLSRKLEDPSGRFTGDLLILDMNYQVLCDLCEEVNMGENGYVYILDENGEIIYHPQQQLILSGVKKELGKEIVSQRENIFSSRSEDGNKIYTSCRSQQTGWTVVGVADVSELVRNEEVINSIYILMAVFMISVTLVVSVLLSRQITNPIKSLQHVMQDNQENEFRPVHVPVNGRNEIAQLCMSYNRMIEYIGQLLEMNVKKAKEQQKSELRALQAQINPHFLYNTLDSIIWMIETEEQKEAIKMTSALALFFRKAIGTQEVFVTIDEELEYTRQYLIIQRMRYKDKIDFTIQVAPDILKMQMIKMTLQPLVENALYHGLKYKKGKGLIQITGYRMNDQIWFKVSDNGVGMDEDTLKNLFILQKKSRKGSGNGIGLANVQDRIKLYYGEGYGITAESEKGIGTTITVVIPVQEERKDE